MWSEKPTAEADFEGVWWRDFVGVEGHLERMNSYIALQQTIARYWSRDISPMSKTYMPKITIQCPAGEFSGRYDHRGADMLNIRVHATGEMGVGQLQYYVPKSNPLDWKIVIDSRTSQIGPTFAAMLQRPYTWNNFQRCGNWQPLDPAVPAWRNDKEPWCPPLLGSKACRYTLDFYSTAEDEECLARAYINPQIWKQWGDRQCSKQGNVIKTVSVPSPVSIQPQVPPFAARRVTYNGWGAFLLPLDAEVRVFNGMYAKGVESYEGHDSTAFKGVRRAVDHVGAAFDCPSGTWMTCTKALASGATTGPGICSYPVAFIGSTAEEWRKDIITFYAESGGVTNEITQQLSFSNQKGRNAYEKMVPGLGDTSCFPCATAGGKTHYGVTVPAPSPIQVNNYVLPFYCPGSFEPPQECPIGKVVPHNRVTGLSTSAVCVCDHGYRPDEDGCVMCPGGTFCNVTDAYDATSGAVKTPDPRPIPCPSGYWAGAGSSYCTKCSTDASACTVRQQMSACTPVEGTSDISVRTQYQKEAPRCVSCLDCKGVGKEDGRPCVGTKQKQS